MNAFTFPLCVSHEVMTFLPRLGSTREGHKASMIFRIVLVHVFTLRSKESFYLILLLVLQPLGFTYHLNIFSDYSTVKCQ